MHHRLCRIDRGGERVLVSEHDSLQAGWIAGQDAVHADSEHAYALYTDKDQRVARFGFSRIETSQLSLPGMVL
jgi:hypothetical protein